MDKTIFILNESTSEPNLRIPYVTESQMREVDRIAVEEFSLGILQMMENAGRNLARLTLRYLASRISTFQKAKVVVLAGSGGNGGGGICAVRHLHNRGLDVNLVLTKPYEEFTGVARHQLAIMEAAGLTSNGTESAQALIAGADVLLDALIGYSLKGAPRSATARLIELVNGSGKHVISLDLPSGLNATTGKTPGACVKASQTLTLALPKPGLANLISGQLFLADIGIPAAVYHPLGIHFDPFWADQYILSIRRAEPLL